MNQNLYGKLIVTFEDLGFEVFECKRELHIIKSGKKLRLIFDKHRRRLLTFYFDGEDVCKYLLNAKKEYNLTTYAFDKLSDYYIVRDVKILSEEFFNNKYLITSYTLFGRVYFKYFSFLRGNVRLQYRSRPFYDALMIYSIVLMPIVILKDWLLLSGKIGENTSLKDLEV